MKTDAKEIYITKAVFEEPTLSNGATLLYGKMLAECDDIQIYRKKREQTAIECFVTPTSISKWLWQLRDAGIVTLEEEGNSKVVQLLAF